MKPEEYMPAKKHKFSTVGFTADDEPTEEQWHALIKSLILGMPNEDIVRVMDEKGKAILHIFLPRPGSVEGYAEVTDTRVIATCQDHFPTVEHGCLLVIVWRIDSASTGQYRLLNYCLYGRSTTILTREQIEQKLNIK